MLTVARPAIPPPTTMMLNCLLIEILFCAFSVDRIVQKEIHCFLLLRFYGYLGFLSTYIQYFLLRPLFSRVLHLHSRDDFKTLIRHMAISLGKPVLGRPTRVFPEVCMRTLTRRSSAAARPPNQALTRAPRRRPSSYRVGIHKV